MGGTKTPPQRGSPGRIPDSGRTSARASPPPIARDGCGWRATPPLAPVAESRRRDDAERAEVERGSDARDGPDAGVHRLSALECLARGVDHVPERDATRIRYYGAFATRWRVGWWRRGIVRMNAPQAEPSGSAPAADGPALRARRRRWAERLRRVYAVDVEGCPRCGGAARILGFVTPSAGVRRMLAHLERRGIEARAGPWAGAAAAPGCRGASRWRPKQRPGSRSGWLACASGRAGWGECGRAARARVEAAAAGGRAGARGAARVGPAAA